MDKRVIDYLRPRAAAILRLVARRRSGHNFSDIELDDGHKFDYRIHADDKLELCLKYNNGKDTLGGVIFDKISPKEIIKAIYHDPVSLGQETKDARSTEIVNESGVMNLDRTYEFEEGCESTQEESIAVGTNLSVEQTIRVGNEATMAGSETTVGFELSTDWSRTKGSSSSTTRTVSTSISVPPKTRAVLSATEKTVEFKQDIEYWCDLDHKITVWSRDDWSMSWDNTDQLVDVVAGVAPEGISMYKEFRGSSLGSRDQGYIRYGKDGDKGLHTKFTIKFKEATQGNLRVKTEKL